MRIKTIELLSRDWEVEQRMLIKASSFSIQILGNMPEIKYDKQAINII